MNPQLVYMITQQRISEYHRAARRYRPSGDLRRSVRDHLARATDSAASNAEGRESR